jgi:hypothetical protein
VPPVAIAIALVLLVLPAAVTATVTHSGSGQPQHTPPGSDSEVAAGDAEMRAEFAEAEAKLTGMREQRRGANVCSY